eukprot:Nk52_evm34s304 gene=Nk52_evmTU34s304
MSASVAYTYIRKSASRLVTMQPNTNYEKITHVLFDMDGLILDTESVYTKVTSDILRPYGKEFSFELKSKMMGRTAMEASTLLVEETGIPLSAEEYCELRNRMHMEYFPDCKVLPDRKREGKGGERFVEEEKKILERDWKEEKKKRRRLYFYLVLSINLILIFTMHKIPCAVATSSASDSFVAKTQNHSDLFALFDKIVRGDDSELKNSKPAPDIFQIAARRLGYDLEKEDPKHCLVFEDAPSGVAAGVAAGMQVVMVPDPRMAKEQMKGATKVLGSLEDFLPEEWGLPPYDN